MDIPEYVNKTEVKRICDELGLRDWSSMERLEVNPEEAEIILKAMDIKGMDIPVDVFRDGLEVELEHGTMYLDANVTNNHPILTGKIVLAHLHESMDYYARLEVAEIEGDMLKAAVAGDLLKLMTKYQDLVKAKKELAVGEEKELP